MLSSNQKRRGFVFTVAFVSLFLISTMTTMSMTYGSVESTSFENADRFYVPSQSVDNLTDVELFMNNKIDQQIIQYHIQGAHVSLVKDGLIYFSNGYGLFENGSGWQSVSANSTLFRVASLSKAVTATAIMQLVEDNQLDLATDVNEYLQAFKVPATFTEPITIAHLLSHTAGFENTIAPVYVNSADELLTLEEILIAQLPHRIIPPGQAAMYSNFGYALLGYIIEVISGVPFEDYIRTEIFEPLGMDNSYFEQVLPDEALAQISGGYYYSSAEGYIETNPEFATITPAAGMITTAEDYGRFLIAHLNNGTYNGNRILDNDTVQLMHQVHFEARPEMDGVCYGFYERNMNNLEMLGHGGITYSFRSTQVMLLEENIGLYVCYNTDTAWTAGAELVEAFVDHFYPSSVNITPLEGYQERAQRYVGEYINSHSYFSTVQKLTLFAGRPFDYLKVTANDDGSIKVQETRFISGIPSYSSFVLSENDFIEVEPGFFRDAAGDSKETIAFLENENGEITYVYFSRFPPESWVRTNAVEALQSSIVVLTTVFLSLLVYLPLFIIIEIYSFMKHRESVSVQTKIVSMLTLGVLCISLIIPLAISFGTLNDILIVTYLLPIMGILIGLICIVLGYSFGKKLRIDNHDSILRLVLAAQAPIVVSVVVIVNFYSLMSMVLVLMALYLLLVALSTFLVIFAWTKRGGFDPSSRIRFIERILYTVVIILSIITIWALSLWGAFTFVV